VFFTIEQVLTCSTGEGKRRCWKVGVQLHAPVALSSGGKNHYLFYRKLSGLQDRPWRVRKNSLPRVFEARTVQLVASGYPDIAILTAILT